MSHVFSHLKLRTRLLLVLASIVLIQALISGSFTLHYIKQVLEERIGEQALQLSRVVSVLPQIRQGLIDQDPGVVQPFAEMIREQTNARFIVVGDRDGIRYSHPLPERIGKKRVGGDNQRALEGESYVSRAVGSLGPSLRGKSPVRDDQGNVIGVTSVGYMLDSVENTIGSYQDSVMQIVLISLERYREQLTRLQELDTVDQSDIDAIMPRGRAVNPQGEATLPKGVDILTLNKVRDFLALAEQSIAASDVGGQLGVSRTTARRYLEYLVSTRELQVDLSYGGVGRPERYYSRIS
jgi:hypothetical protein